MPITAIIPVASLAAANASLEAQDFGPRNFSVPCYGSTGASHGALHSWVEGAFAAAVKALAGVKWVDSAGGTNVSGLTVTSTDPVDLTQQLIASQAAAWGERAPALPSTGNVTAGSYYKHGGSMWYVIQTFNRSTYGAAPGTYPALIREVRSPYSVAPWRQPIDAFDSYQLVNPFTGKPDRCTEGGLTYESKIANNVWSPSGYPAGWQQVTP